MKDISALDSNFISRDSAGRDWQWQDGFAAPFVLDGFPYIDGEGHQDRLPLAVAQQCLCQASVIPMSRQGTGEVLRFRSDSPRIAVQAQFHEIWRGANLCASCGFDLYAGSGIHRKFIGNRYISDPTATSFDGCFDRCPAPGIQQDFLLYFPIHCAVSQIRIGVQPGCRVAPPTPYTLSKTVLFYGSSITACGAAGRPALIYPAQTARMLDCRMLNMGLAGACKGDLAIAGEIVKQKPDVLVLEYDYNADNAEFLAKTHEPFFRRVRQGLPQLPIVMMSLCCTQDAADFQARRQVILTTYLNALKQGDSFVDFLDGETLFAGYDRGDCTLDNCHPNDLGAYLMAKALVDRLGKWLR